MRHSPLIGYDSLGGWSGPLHEIFYCWARALTTTSSITGLRSSHPSGPFAAASNKLVSRACPPRLARSSSPSGERREFHLKLQDGGKMKEGQRLTAIPSRRAVARRPFFVHSAHGEINSRNDHLFHASPLQVYHTASRLMLRKLQTTMSWPLKAILHEPAAGKSLPPLPSLR